MPVMAAQLVLATAAENGSLVIDERFAEQLPLVRAVNQVPMVDIRCTLHIASHTSRITLPMTT